MNNFLNNLYQEDLTKQGAADLRRLYGSLSAAELAEIVGLPKVAVAGPTSPACPTGLCAADAKVTAKAPAKKTGPAEFPTANVKMAEVEAMTAAIKRLGRAALEGPTISPSMMTEVVGHTARTSEERAANYPEALGVEEKTAGVASRVAKDVIVAGKHGVRGALAGAGVGGLTGMAAGSIADLADKEGGHHGRDAGVKSGLTLGALLGAIGGVQKGVTRRGLNVLSSGFEQQARHGMPTNNTAMGKTKLNQATLLCTAMRAVEGAPENIKQAAIELAASRL